MYLLKINTDDGTFRHIVARVEWPRLSVSDNGNPKRSLFLDYFCHASPLWLQVPVQSASLRIDVSPDSGPVTWHGLTIATDDGELIRQAIAALMRLDGIENCTVAAPGDLADFQTHYANPDASWLTLDDRPMSTSVGGEFFSPNRIFDNLPTLLASATAMGHALSYQALFSPTRPHPDQLRRARKAAAFLEREPGVPQRLAAAQGELARHLDGATLLAEEAVAIAPSGTGWLTRWLRENAKAPGMASAALSRDAVDVDSDNAEAFANHIHPSLILAPADAADPRLIAKFWNASEAASLFRCDGLWRAGAKAGEPPPISPLPMFFGGGNKPSGPGAAQHQAAGAPNDFYFVSYAHKDIEALRPILDKLTSDGIRVWIDEQIQVGEEWDTRLETMITTSAGLLVFLSPHYVASKHCRRELKFADALNKDIFASALSEFPLAGGLGYIFASLQYASGPTDRIAGILAQRLRGRGNGTSH